MLTDAKDIRAVEAISQQARAIESIISLSDDAILHFTDKVVTYNKELGKEGEKIYCLISQIKDMATNITQHTNAIL